MKARASDFRYANILPHPDIDRFAGMRVKAYRFLKDFFTEKKWWKYEQYIELDFDDDSNSVNEVIAAKCSACGLCCKDIPTHQIGIYMSPREVEFAEANGHKIKHQGTVVVKQMPFKILAVEENGDCSMLGPKGCTLGDLKPLWCKIYHCEKFQGRPYSFGEENGSEKVT